MSEATVIDHAIDKMLEVIESIECFRPRYTSALIGFLQDKRVHLVHRRGGTKPVPDRPHTRATLRCIQACDFIGLDTPPALAPDCVRFVVEEAWKDPSKTAFQTHNFYTISNILFLARRCGSPLLSKIRVEVTRQLRAELRRDKPNPYLILFAQDALGLAKQPKAVSALALKLLYEQIVYHSSRDVMDFDSAKLAACALLVSNAEPTDLQMGRAQYEQAVRRAAEIIFADDELPLSMRTPRPQHGERNAVIHTVPWEEVLLISRLPLRFIPVRLPIVPNMVRDLTSKFLELPTGEHGWTLESDAAFPAPMSWITAVYSELLERSLVLSRYAYTECLLREAERQDPTRVARFENSTIDGSVKEWSDILETDEAAKRLLETNILGGCHRTPEPKKRSVLLFGPPGTAKTTMVKGLAFQLLRSRMKTRTDESWPLLTINPADVLDEGGYQTLISNLRVLLRKVRALSEVVVFFDEAENLVFGREEKGETRLDRLITAAMLPLLSNIDSEDIVFVMATNHVRTIDAAVRRRGRFGVRVAVGTPNYEARAKLISRVLVGIPECKKLRRRLAKESSGLTIKEIVGICQALKATGSRLNEDEILESVKAARSKAEISSDMRATFEQDVARYSDGNLRQATSNP